jgi:hypothetical protein
MSTKLPEGKLRSYEAIALTPSRAVTIPTMDLRSMVAELFEHREAAALIALRDKAFTTEIQSAAKASTEAAEARMDAAMQRQGRELIVDDESKERP